MTRISRVTGYRLDLPFRDGAYRCSGGRSAMGFDSLVVRIDSDDGAVGWGEMAPLGSFYDPAFSAGARAAFAELAPLLIGGHASEIEVLRRRMDLHMNGHPYAKAAIDMALWDLLGHCAGLPLVDLLGGQHGETVDLYRSVSQDTPERMIVRALKYVAEGYRRIQVKVGLDPDEDVARIEAVREAVGPGVALFADANGGWSTHQARRFLRATRHLDYYMEQPCPTYAECRAIRGDCDRPLVLDESIDSLPALVLAHADRVADAVTIKIARVGGVSQARLLRDVAVGLGIAVTVEDTGGAEIDTAAMLHLSLSTPAAFRLHTVDFHNWVTRSNGRGLPAASGGAMGIGAGAGLGITVDEASFGPPLMEFGGAG